MSLLDRIKNDDDTIVTDLEGVADAGHYETEITDRGDLIDADPEEDEEYRPARQAGESAQKTEDRAQNTEEPDERGKEIVGKSRRIAAAFLWLTAGCAGTAAVLSAAFAYVIASLEDARYYKEATLQEMIEDGDIWWVARFSGKTMQADTVGDIVTLAAVLSLIAAAAVVILCVMSGRYSGRGAELTDGGKPAIRLNRFDKIWTELHLAAVCSIPVAAAYIAHFSAKILRSDNNFGFIDFTNVYVPLVNNNYVYGVQNSLVLWYCTAGIAACVLAELLCFLSLVKKLKARRLIECSLIGKLLRLLGIGAAAAGKGAAKAGRGIAVVFRKRSRSFTVPSDSDRLAVIKLIAKYVIIVAVLMLAPEFILFVVFPWEHGIYIVLKLAAVAAAAWLVTGKLRKLLEIREGVIQTRAGNLTYRIPVKEDETGPKTDLDRMASDINHISEASHEAVKAELKNERMKTDLISNVSHDLKTPLTSMISYLDILEREGLDSPDAPEHLAIVREKTDRLRTLTEELFEAAKASSGNIPCEIEDIDLSALIDQSLAEMGDRLAAKDLDIRKKIKAENTIVRADGRLLYRVLENLLGNISKYALEGSRVYIDVSEEDARPGSSSFGGKSLLLEVKNISKDELNISADELMERFTRGDQSRNTEGSGLGLAIARDLVNLMGGSFDITIDGDMFKASVALPASGI